MDVLAAAAAQQQPDGGNASQRQPNALNAAQQQPNAGRSAARRQSTKFYAIRGNPPVVYDKWVDAMGAGYQVAQGYGNAARFIVSQEADEWVTGAVNPQTRAVRHAQGPSALVSLFCFVVRHHVHCPPHIAISITISARDPYPVRNEPDVPCCLLRSRSAQIPKWMRQEQFYCSGKWLLRGHSRDRTRFGKAFQRRSQDVGGRTLCGHDLLCCALVERAHSELSIVMLLVAVSVAGNTTVTKITSTTVVRDYLESIVFFSPLKAPAR